MSAPVSPDTALQATSLYPAAQFNGGGHITRHLNLLLGEKNDLFPYGKNNNSQKGVLSSILSVLTKYLLNTDAGSTCHNFTCLHLLKWGLFFFFRAAGFYLCKHTIVLRQSVKG